MDYHLHYTKLITRGAHRDCDPTLIYEHHHIIPRCMGGTDDAENIVDLTLREHFVAHQLLTKMYPEHDGLKYSAWMMCACRTHSTSKKYDWIRRLRNVVSDQEIIDASVGAKTYKEVMQRLSYTNNTKVKAVLISNGIYLKITEEEILEASLVCKSVSQICDMLEYRNDVRVSQVCKSHGISFVVSDQEILETAYKSPTFKSLCETLNYYQYDRIRNILRKNGISYSKVITNDEIIQAAVGCESYTEVLQKLNYTNHGRVKKVLHLNGVVFRTLKKPRGNK